MKYDADEAVFFKAKQMALRYIQGIVPEQQEQNKKEGSLTPHYRVVLTRNQPVLIRYP